MWRWGTRELRLFYLIQERVCVCVCVACRNARFSYYRFGEGNRNIRKECGLTENSLRHTSIGVFLGIWLVVSSSLTDGSVIISAKYIQALFLASFEQSGKLSLEHFKGSALALPCVCVNDSGEMWTSHLTDSDLPRGRVTTTFSAGHLKHTDYTLPRINVKIGICVLKVACIGTER